MTFAAALRLPMHQAAAAMVSSARIVMEIIKDTLHGSSCRETETSSTQTDPWAACLEEVIATSQAPGSFLGLLMTH